MLDITLLISAADRSTNSRPQNDFYSLERVPEIAGGRYSWHVCSGDENDIPAAVSPDWGHCPQCSEAPLPGKLWAQNLAALWYMDVLANEIYL